MLRSYLEWKYYKVSQILMWRVLLFCCLMGSHKLYHSSVKAWQPHSSCLPCVALVDLAFETWLYGLIQGTLQGLDSSLVAVLPASRRLEDGCERSGMHKHTSVACWPHGRLASPFPFQIWQFLLPRLLSISTKQKNLRRKTLLSWKEII